MTYLNKTILVTGAAGSIGSELVKQLLDLKPKKLICLDQDETGIFNLTQQYDIVPVIGNIREKDKISEVFTRYEPEVVFHCAAYKHVPLMESFPNEAFKTNVLGTRNMIDVSLKHKIEKFVFISSDKAANSKSTMGQTKKEGERMTQAAGYISVRFGNVLKSRGSVIPIWEKQIAEGKSLTVTHPHMKRYFMSIEEACKLVIKGGEIGLAGEIVVLDMGKPVMIMDLAKKMIEKSGKDIPIEIIGVRAGETLFEEIIASDEQISMREGFFIIKPIQLS